MMCRSEKRHTNNDQQIGQLFWPSTAADLTKFCRECHKCQRLDPLSPIAGLQPVLDIRPMDTMGTEMTS